MSPPLLPGRPPRSLLFAVHVGLISHLDPPPVSPRSSTSTIQICSMTQIQLGFSPSGWLASCRRPGARTPSSFSLCVSSSPPSKIPSRLRRNLRLFCSAPGAYVEDAIPFTRSVIMLNTDAHNPAIKAHKKMTKEQFLKNNRGLDSGHDLPKEFLERIYDR